MNKKSVSKKKDAGKAIDVRAFIYQKMKAYNGGLEFLAGPTEKTKALWEECKKLIQKEKDNNGVLEIDAKTVSTITSHRPGYINKTLETVVGLQTEAPLKRAIKPYGGIRVVDIACQEHGYELSLELRKIFNEYRKTHNDGVFSAYTEQMRKLRKAGVLTGLPDAYARGRIIGDYRRVALYGVDRLIEEKKKDLNGNSSVEMRQCLVSTTRGKIQQKKSIIGEMTDEKIRLREEIFEQIKALEFMKMMAETYGYDISRPAQGAREAVQWTYFAYLAAIKEQDGAAMSLGNVSGFFDIYIEDDIKNNKLTEEEAQELIDQFVIKLRLVRHLRTADYNQLFAGDPTWVTEALGGLWQNGQHKVTKTTYRFLQTLYNLGPAPEPNLTVLWSKKLPKPFKEFCAKVSIDTSSIQYENDDLMRDQWCGDDYGISCCVSRLGTGHQMQFFGARCNIAKALLLAINGGVDEITGIKIYDDLAPIKGKYLPYEKVLENYKKVMAHLAADYVSTMNVIHYMHDKYYYERAQMALLDSDVDRLMAFGLAGLSVAADSLSAIKYAKVAPVRDAQGIAKDFAIKGDFPKYGNDNNSADSIAKMIVSTFSKELAKHHIYRDAKPTLSILTITSNVVYGHKTGATPDGRKAGAPFAPGANPMHGRDTHGAIASLNSVAKISYKYALDGVSNTFSVTPQTLGKEENEKNENLVSLLDGYFSKGAHHLNVNVLNKQTLLDAMAHPELYPQLTIRVSGYAVNFVKLSREQQQEVLARTFFERI